MDPFDSYSLTDLNLVFLLRLIKTSFIVLANFEYFPADYIFAAKLVIGLQIWLQLRLQRCEIRDVKVQDQSSH